MLCLVSVRYRLGAGLFIKVSIMVPTAFQLGYPNTSGFREVVKATMYGTNKESMSDEDLSSTNLQHHEFH
jgi:hypothetical protein